MRPSRVVEWAFIGLAMLLIAVTIKEVNGGDWWEPDGPEHHSWSLGTNDSIPETEVIILEPCGYDT